MSHLERFLRLPQPNFESGEKTLSNVVSRRLLQKSGCSVELINRITASYLSPEVRNCKSDIEMAVKKADQFDQLAWRLFQRNIIYLPNQVFIRASAFHCDNWLRDTFIGTLFLDLPEVEFRILSQFNNPDLHPHLPTTRLFPGNRFWAFDDESTMLGLIWRAKLFQKGVHLSSAEKDGWIQRWQWVRQHVQEGFYITPAGTEHSWFDTFRFPEPDVVTYNQGIYATGAIAAQKMLLENDQSVIEDAKNAYQVLTHESGRLQFSKNIPYTDCSLLFGEFLAIHLFSQNLLSDETVRKTMEMMPKIRWQIPVVLKEDSSYLSPSEFNRPYQAGDYHNGAEWPVWSAIAQATAELHGVRHDRALWQDLFSRLQSNNHPEYIFTGHSGGQHPLSQENHLWNTVVYLAAKKVMDPDELKQVSQSRKTRLGLYSEAFQIS